jgi:hypothetical protein
LPTLPSATPERPGAPVRLRPTANRRIGTTAFFRNRALLARVLAELKASGRERFSVLFHACSIGAEVWSFVAAYMADPDLRQRQLVCHATDLEPSFVAFAARARYPEAVLAGMTDGEAAGFRREGNEILPNDDLARCVSFLPACSFTAFGTESRYDLVFLLNALVYVDAPAQSRALAAIAGYNDGWLVTTGFHADGVRADMERAGYVPVTEDAEAIHNGWTDRRVDAAGPQLVPGLIFHPWSLPPFSRGPDWDYRFCALFRRA